MGMLYKNTPCKPKYVCDVDYHPIILTAKHFSQWVNSNYKINLHARMVQVGM